MLFSVLTIVKKTVMSLNLWRPGEKTDLSLQNSCSQKSQKDSYLLK